MVAYRLIIKIIDKLGAVLRDEENFEEVEVWIRKSLIGCEKLLGPAHIENIRSTTHLTLFLSMMDRLDEAELVSRRAVAGFEMGVGHDHHLAFIWVHTLGKLFRLQDRYEQAAEPYRRALDGFTKFLGPDSRGTLSTFSLWHSWKNAREIRGSWGMPGSDRRGQHECSRRGLSAYADLHQGTRTGSRG